MPLKLFTAAAWISLVAAFLAVSAVVLLRIENSYGPAYVIAGVTYIDGSPRPPISNATVIIRRGRVEFAGEPAQARVPSGAHAIRGEGRFIFPLDPSQRVAIGQRASFLLLSVNPALDFAYKSKVDGRMEDGRWTQFPQ